MVSYLGLSYWLKRNPYLPSLGQLRLERILTTRSRAVLQHRTARGVMATILGLYQAGRRQVSPLPPHGTQRRW